MVRQSKQTPDQKRDAHKKKTQPQDKPSDTTVWPCRINGCNKHFAREADLKRHQRTTKLHSVPGFACPQCDARFTRTDALRRHQKSRHNGVVMEPADGVDGRGSVGEEGPRSSGSRSKSRSRTPSSKEGVAPTSLPPATVSPQSYYRQHTFAGGMSIEGHYPPAIGLPTSATRLHQTSWQPWTGDPSQPPPHIIHPGYAPPYYAPSPQYYRPGTIIHPSPDVVTHQQIPNRPSSSSNGDSSSCNGSPAMPVDPPLDPSEPSNAESRVIDPSLVSPSGSHGDNSELSEGLSRIPGTRSPHEQHVPSPRSGEPSKEEEGTDSETTIVHHLLASDPDHPFSSPHSASLEHPLDMEQILTEDGEPMLNPAELLTQVSINDDTPTILDHLMHQILTQESLASPPPS